MICTQVPKEIQAQFNQYVRGKKLEKQRTRTREELIADELTRVPENLSDEDVSDPELHRALRESRESHRVEQFQRRGGEGSSRAELGRSASMRAPEGFGHNKRLLNVRIRTSNRQPMVDDYLHSKQTSRQPKIFLMLC
jgi:hypothetical protein